TQTSTLSLHDALPISAMRATFQSDDPGLIEPLPDLLAVLDEAQVEEARLFAEGLHVMEHGIAVHEVDGHTDGHHLHIRRELARVIAYHHGRVGRGPRLAAPDFLQVHDGVLDDLVGRDRDLVDLAHATPAHLVVLGVDDLAGSWRGRRVDDFPLDRAAVGR